MIFLTKIFIIGLNLNSTIFLISNLPVELLAALCTFTPVYYKSSRPHIFINPLRKYCASTPSRIL